MNSLFTTVITTINSPTKALKEIEGSYSKLIVIGDIKTPDFKLDGCEYYNVEQQRSLPFRFAKVCPTKHYARKNIGYLLAMKEGKPIVETDDDNIPNKYFWSMPRQLNHFCKVAKSKWVNVYGYFTPEYIWPRGFPLNKLNDVMPSWGILEDDDVICPVQQGLADGDPDVDAIYRLVLNHEVEFYTGREVAIAKDCWCPFNSQNTTWFPEAYLLMYLPMTCSWRACDIWRSFVAQRIMWENGWNLLFHSPTVRQERNPHNLMVDFNEEIPCYIHNEEITKTLYNLKLYPGPEHIVVNMMTCYNALKFLGVVSEFEIKLLSAWLEDASGIGK